MRLYFASHLYLYLVSCSWCFRCLRWGIWGSGRSDQSFCPNTDIFFPPATFPSFDKLNNFSIHQLSLSPAPAGWYRITPCLHSPLWRSKFARSTHSNAERWAAQAHHPTDRCSIPLGWRSLNELASKCLGGSCRPDLTPLRWSHASRLWPSVPTGALTHRPRAISPPRRGLELL